MAINIDGFEKIIKSQNETIYAMKPVLLAVPFKELREGDMLLTNQYDMVVKGEITSINSDLNRIYYSHPYTRGLNWLDCGDTQRFHILRAGTVEGGETITYHRPTNQEIYDELCRMELEKGRK